MNTAKNNIRQITVDNYLSDGKICRVFIVSLEKNILVDLKIRSQSERLLIAGFIRTLRMASFLFSSFSINIHTKSFEAAR
jgi:hypothetical protein